MTVSLNKLVITNDQLFTSENLHSYLHQKTYTIPSNCVFLTLLHFVLSIIMQCIHSSELRGGLCTGGDSKLSPGQGWASSRPRHVGEPGRVALGQSSSTV